MISADDDHVIGLEQTARGFKYINALQTVLTRVTRLKKFIIRPRKSDISVIYSNWKIHLFKVEFRCTHFDFIHAPSRIAFIFSWCMAVRFMPF